MYCFICWKFTGINIELIFVARENFTQKYLVQCACLDLFKMNFRLSNGSEFFFISLKMESFFVTKPIKRIVIKPVCYFSTDVAIWYKRIHSSWLGFAIRVESTHPLIQIYIYIYFMIWIKFLYDFRKIIKTRSNKNDFFGHFLTLSFRVRFKSSHKCRYRS